MFDHVTHWTLDRLDSIDHEKRVANWANQLFELTVDRHGLDESYRPILHMAAMVHDVGRAEEDEEHPKIGAKWIRDDRSLNLPKNVRNCLAYLTRRHRGERRPIESDKWFVPMTTADRRAWPIILTLLRAADAMDSRGRGPTALAVTRSGDQLLIQFQHNPRHHIALYRFSAADKLQELSQELRLSVRTILPNHRRVA